MNRKRQVDYHRLRSTHNNAGNSSSDECDKQQKSNIHTNPGSQQVSGSSQDRAATRSDVYARNKGGQLQVRKILDNRYLLVKTIADGRYGRVKLAIDLDTDKKVAIKILKVTDQINKYQALNGLHSEIEILSECEHENVIKIKAASFDGTIVKEVLLSSDMDTSTQQNNQIDKSTNQTISTSNNSHASGTSTSHNLLDSTSSKKLCSDFNELQSPETEQQYLSNQTLEGEGGSATALKSTNSNDPRTWQVIGRQNNICYYVMKLAELGEVYQLVETNSDIFSPVLVKNLFMQLISGLTYLHQVQGVVHRDIKPENLLIDKKFRLIIADFNFATRLKQTNSYANNNCEFDPLVERNFAVGSEQYNAPELVDLEDCFQDEDASSDSVPIYDGVKSDIFSAAVTMFLMMMKFSPFRRAQIKDPYFKRLQHSDKRHFWKIFSSLQSSQEFKDLFEKCTTLDPNKRPTLEQIRDHNFLSEDNQNEFTVEQNQKELKEAQSKLKTLLETQQSCIYGSQTEKQSETMAASQTALSSDISAQQDEEQYQKLRHSLIKEVESISSNLQYKKKLKQIKKQCKNMFAQEEPSYKMTTETMAKIHKDSYTAQIQQNHSNANNSSQNNPPNAALQHQQQQMAPENVNVQTTTHTAVTTSSSASTTNQQILGYAAQVQKQTTNNQFYYSDEEELKQRQKSYKEE